MNTDSASLAPQVWLRSALVDDGTWPAVLVDHDLAMVWAPRSVLEAPPADLHVALVETGDGASRWMISDVLLPEGVLEHDPAGSALATVRLYQSTGVHARISPADPGILSRGTESAPGALEDIGVLPAGWRDATPPVDIDGSRPSPAVSRVHVSVGASSLSVFCKLCPWWCMPHDPHGDPEPPQTPDLARPPAPTVDG